MVVEVYQDDASTIIGNDARMAEALGADLQSPELVEARAAFDSAGEALKAAVAAKPGLTVMATYADTEGLYVAQPKDFPDLLEFQHLGVEMIVPDGADDYWAMLSWEQVDRYPADVLVHDIRSFSIQSDVLVEDQPTWAALPAVKAGQVAAWSAETVLSYQGFTVALGDLAAVIAGAADIA